MLVKYIGPFDAIELDGYGVIAHGATVDVAAVVAGRPPSPRLVAAHLELADAVAALDHPRCVELREEIIGLDPGEGLLAQDTNWVSAPSTKKAKPASEEPQP